MWQHFGSSSTALGVEPSHPHLSQEGVILVRELNQAVRHQSCPKIHELHTSILGTNAVLMWYQLQLFLLSWISKWNMNTNNQWSQIMDEC